MKTISDCDPLVRADAMVIVGNCYGLEVIEDLISDGKLEEAIAEVSRLRKCNFTAFKALADIYEFDPTTGFKTIMDQICPDSPFPDANPRR